MNNIQTHPVKDLGYNFIESKYIPEGADEYYLRNIQNEGKSDYRALTTQELDTLVHNRNSSDNWNNILVSEDFNATLVKNCKFFGLVRIGALQPLIGNFTISEWRLGYTTAPLSVVILVIIFVLTM